MKAFDFIVPVNDNNGKPYTAAKCSLFKAGLLDAYNGYTILGQCKGAWRDPKDGKVYLDDSVVVRLIADEVTTAIELFFATFPDQLCVAYTSGSDAWLIDNANPPH
jgi:hypothetical protein